MQISINDIKSLREQTGAGIADCRKALVQSDGDMGKARQWLKIQGVSKTFSKTEREVKAGLVDVYSHGGKVGVIVELLCETDFVARTDDFKNLAHEIALQVASMNPSSTEELLSQEYIRDNSQNVAELIRSVSGKLGENIQIRRFERLVLGESTET